MTLIIPLHARQTFNSDVAFDEPVLLIAITDVTLGDNVSRFCSYPVQRLTSDPLVYGLISNGDIYIYQLTGTVPSDTEGSPLSTTIAMDNITQQLTSEFVGYSAENEVTLSLVLASDPDTIIRSFPMMRITACTVNDDTISVTIERNRKILGDTGAVEPWPSGRQTYLQAPGLRK